MRAVCRSAAGGRVGIDDNFFELGGDSIVSIQLVSRARQAGLSLTPRAVFQHQTVAGLAAAAGVSRMAAALTAAARHRGRRGAATPIMRWLKERGGPLGRFSQSMLLQVPAGLPEGHLRAALQAVLDHHDALRLRLDAGRRKAAALRSPRWVRVAAGEACGGSMSSAAGGGAAASAWD